MSRHSDLANYIVTHRRGEAVGDPQNVIATATLTTIGLVIAAAAAGVGAYSAQAQADAQKSAAKFNAAVATNNATAAAQQAQYQADRIRTRNRQLAGSARANLAKSGVDIEAGSSADIMMDSGIQGELDRAAAIYTGAVSSGNQSSAAQLERSRAGYASTAGAIGVGSSLLSGANHATQIANNPSFRE